MMPAEGVSGKRRTLRFALAGVAVLGGALLLSCSSVAPPPGLADAGPTLAEAAAAAAAGDVAAEATVEQGVARFLEIFSDFRPEPVLRRAEAAYGEKAYLNDGFVELRGNEEIARYLSHSAELAPSLVVEMQDVVQTNGGGVYLRWQMRYGAGSDEVVAPGMSHLLFDASGRILYHRDYWDASGALGLHLPLVTRALNAVRSRLH